jgi:hypothetical protein
VPDVHFTVCCLSGLAFATLDRIASPHPNYYGLARIYCIMSPHCLQREQWSQWACAQAGTRDNACHLANNTWPICTMRGGREPATRPGLPSRCPSYGPLLGRGVSSFHNHTPTSPCRGVFGRRLTAQRAAAKRSAVRCCRHDGRKCGQHSSTECVQLCCVFWTSGVHISDSKPAFLSPFT